MSNTTPKPSTENEDDRFRDFDLWPAEQALTVMAQAQARAIIAVQAAIPAIATAAELAAARLRDGGRLIYVGAGSSGLLALLDALELPQTFGISESQIAVLVAGGAGITDAFLGGFEDDHEAGLREVEEAEIGVGDCVIAVSASGRTPYTLAALGAAARAGASTIAIACNAGTPMLQIADVAILLESGPEVPAGSTRMAAGTAQKAALNMLSTLTATLLGHVVDGLMVNVRADNLKLRERAARIVMRLAHVEIETAIDALGRTDFAVKEAVLLAAGAPTLVEAEAMLAAAHGDLRAALAAWRGSGG